MVSSLVGVDGEERAEGGISHEERQGVGVLHLCRSGLCMAAEYNNTILTLLPL